MTHQIAYLIAAVKSYNVHCSPHFGFFRELDTMRLLSHHPLVLSD